MGVNLVNLTLYRLHTLLFGSWVSVSFNSFHARFQGSISQSGLTPMAGALRELAS